MGVFLVHCVLCFAGGSDENWFSIKANIHWQIWPLKKVFHGKS